MVLPIEKSIPTQVHYTEASAKDLARIYQFYILGPCAKSDLVGVAKICLNFEEPRLAYLL